jgi:hypothetical protein
MVDIFMNSDLTWNCLASTYQLKKSYSLLLRGIAQTNKNIVIMPQNTNSRKFQFLTEKHIRTNLFQLTRWQSAKLRDSLPKGIYWVQLAQGGLYHWNWTLLQDYLVNGDRPQHRELVEEFVSSLPSATGGETS